MLNATTSEYYSNFWCGMDDNVSRIYIAYIWATVGAQLALLEFIDRLWFHSSTIGYFGPLISVHSVVNIPSFTVAVTCGGKSLVS